MLLAASQLLAGAHNYSQLLTANHDYSPTALQLLTSTPNRESILLTGETNRPLIIVCTLHSSGGEFKSSVKHIVDDIFGLGFELTHAMGFKLTHSILKVHE